jgi:hypothetical protein
LATFSGNWPACEMPVRSPLMSARNTGTPMREKFSARVCSVMVLPVPVAPVTRPWRLARAGSMQDSIAPCLAIRIGSDMGFSSRGGQVVGGPREGGP